MKQFILCVFLFFCNHCTREIISNGVNSDSEMRLISSSTGNFLTKETLHQYKSFYIQSESMFQEIVFDPNNDYFSNVNSFDLKSLTFSDYDWVLFIYNPLEEIQSMPFDLFQAKLEDEDELGSYSFAFDFVHISFLETGDIEFGKKQTYRFHTRREFFPLKPEEPHEKLKKRIGSRNFTLELEKTFRYLFYFPKSNSKNGILKITKKNIEILEFAKNEK